jgi:ELWxxDGT repeat protein
VELRGLTLFKAEKNPEGVPALWRSDGTASGTFVLTSPEVNPFVGSGGAPVAAGGRVFFAAYSGESGQELWATDGTLAGTRQVADLQPGPVGGDLRGLVALGSQVLFHVSTPGAGDELWISDGTAGGTRMVRDLTPVNDEGTHPKDFVVRGTEAFFSTEGALDPRVIWRTDGTAAGTVPYLDGSNLPEVTSVSPLAAIGPKLFFLAHLSPYGALYVREGAAGAARRLADFGVEDWEVGERLIVGDRLYFLGGGRRLWVSDGTAAGTRRVTDAAGIPIDGASGLQSLSGRLVFSYSRDLGVETWTSDGTPAGTRRIARAFWSDPALLGEAGGKILLRGRTLETGFELWAVEP